MDFHKQPLLQGLTPFTRILFLILLVITCFAGAFLIGLLVAGPLFGIGLNDLISSLTDFSDARTIRLLKFFQVIQSFGLFIIPAMLAGYFFERNSIRYLKLNKPSRLFAYIITFALMFASLPFINWMITVNEAIQLPGFLHVVEQWMKTTEAEAAKLTETFMNMPAFGGFLFNMVMIALLPAVGEEFMFRGVLQRMLKEWLGNIHVAIFISAFLFSAMHMQFYGFFPRMMLGMMFGYLFYWTGSLWLPVFGHFINNGSAVIFSYLAQHGLLNGDYEDFGATNNTIFIVFSALAILVLMFAIYRFKPENQPVLIRNDQEN
ncbi:MAG: CPBP family intramembrane metalloprotease [Bacteroidales bacterium]|nr:CPBP family intramembrane metalloprotease [Bacteroidales bacterium]